jgi:hypothetical protein
MLPEHADKSVARPATSAPRQPRQGRAGAKARPGAKACGKQDINRVSSTAQPSALPR